jgi:hypothetical protein
MRKVTLALLALSLTVGALGSLPRRAEAQTICPFCAIGYKCCITGQTARCVRENNPC